MSIKKTLGRVGIFLAVTATVAIGQTNPIASVKIGNLTWTKQNVNIKTPDSWCYDGKESNCAKYGRLYTWGAAQKVCRGMGGTWRLPANEDWDNLMTAVGGVREENEEGDAFYKNAGKKLKSKSGWNNYEGKSGNGTDDYGFSALPGGNRITGDVSFNYVGNSGLWWSATEDGSAPAAYRRYMGSTSNAVYDETVDKGFGYSVRCVAQD